MISIKTNIEINAPKEIIWQILTDFPLFSQWNPFVRKISGSLIPGQRLAIELRQKNGGSMKFKPVVLAYEPNKTLRWKGNLLIPGLFDGEHYFELVEIDRNTCKLTHGENFSGLLPGLMKNMMIETADSFELMNQALKQRAEGMVKK